MLSSGRTLRTVRERRPLVHNITNYVVMNSTANALLAVGASPVMAHAPEEMEAMVGLADALVINIGTLSESWIAAMTTAMRAARARAIPIVLDPVGAGATPYRTETVQKLLAVASPTCIRANASEIRALAAGGGETRGVDSVHATDAAVDAARALAVRHGCVVSVSGETDVIVTADEVARVQNGHPMMARVTGMGCTATAITAACLASHGSPFVAAAHAMAIMGVAGERAARTARGPGTLQIDFLDELARLDPEGLHAEARISKSPS